MRFKKSENESGERVAVGVLLRIARPDRSPLLMASPCVYMRITTSKGELSKSRTWLSKK